MIFLDPRQHFDSSIGPQFSPFSTQLDLSAIESDKAHLDWDYLHRLSDANHDFEMMLLELFIDDCDEHLKQLKGAIAHANLIQIRHVAHYIKGASANIGAQYIQYYAHMIESQVQQTSQLTCLTCFDSTLKQMEVSLYIIKDIWSTQR